MSVTEIRRITPNDDESVLCIANWYLSEWRMPVSTATDKLKNLSAEAGECHFLMTVNNVPVATRGLHNHVGILEKVPHLRKYQHWLALVNTVPDFRGKGLGEVLCKCIQDECKRFGLQEIHLFTDTAERLYTRLGWQPVERVSFGNRM